MTPETRFRLVALRMDALLEFSGFRVAANESPKVIEEKIKNSKYQLFDRKCKDNFSSSGIHLSSIVGWCPRQMTCSSSPSTSKIRHMARLHTSPSAPISIDHPYLDARLVRFLRQRASGRSSLGSCSSSPAGVRRFLLR